MRRPLPGSGCIGSVSGRPASSPSHRSPSNRYAPQKNAIGLPSSGSPLMSAPRAGTDPSEKCSASGSIGPPGGRPSGARSIRVGARCRPGPRRDGVAWSSDQRNGSPCTTTCTARPGVRGTRGPTRRGRGVRRGRAPGARALRAGQRERPRVKTIAHLFAHFQDGLLLGRRAERCEQWLPERFCSPARHRQDRPAHRSPGYAPPEPTSGPLPQRRRRVLRLGTTVDARRRIRRRRRGVRRAPCSPARLRARRVRIRRPGGPGRCCHVTYLSARGVEHAPPDAPLRAVELTSRRAAT